MVLWNIRQGRLPMARTTLWIGVNRTFAPPLIWLVRIAGAKTACIGGLCEFQVDGKSTVGTVNGTAGLAVSGRLRLHIWTTLTPAARAALANGLSDAAIGKLWRIASSR